MNAADQHAEQQAAWIVVTDLDGTLLDHESYSYAPAQSAMDRLAALDIPLILNTSKTRSELEALRVELGNREPFIVENGSAVFVPEGRFSVAATSLAEECAGGRVDTGAPGGFLCKQFGQDYRAIVSWLQARRQRFRFESFSDFSNADLRARTGLGEAQAALALAREFSEPLIWLDSAEALVAFEQELAEAGLSSLRGGRFLHILGNCDKGQSMAWLRRCYHREWQRPVQVVALGDSHNDVAMLEAADIAVVVRSPKHEPPVVKAASRLLLSEREGPAGWGEVMHKLMDGLVR